MMEHRARTKALSVLLSLALMLGLMPGMSLPAYADSSGSLGGNLTWQLSGNTLTISGSGAMPDYSSLPDRPWNSSCSSIQTVNIGNGVTSIGNFAFNGFTSLTSVTIPNSVTSIGKYAFVATKLTSVNIPGNVTKIDTYAFGNCNDLESVTFTPGTADTNLVIGMGAFSSSKTGATVGYGTGSTRLYDNYSSEIKAGDALTKIYKSYSYDGDNKTFTWKSAHTHDFTYAASDATITATCTEGCTNSYNTLPATLTITAPTDLAVDGTAKAATVTNNIPDITPSIVYKKGGNVVDAANVKEPGTYTASVTLTGVKTGENTSGNVTASVEFTITNPDYTIVLPTGLADGTVTADKDKAKFGEEVTLTVTPSDDDHILKTLTVKDSGNNDVTVTDKKFTMPASNVSVSAEFGVKTSAAVTLTTTGAGGTASLMKRTFEPLLSNEQVREGEKFVLSVSTDDESDYTIGFDPSREVSRYVEEFSKDDYRNYVAYAQTNHIPLSFQTDLFWVTMPGADGDTIDVNVTFEKVKTFTILYRPTGNADAVWCKFTETNAQQTEAPFAVEMKKDAVMGDQVVWSAKVTAAFAPNKIAFAANSDSLANASMTDDFTVKQSIQNESDWTSFGSNDGKFVVISGDVKAVVAAFVTNPSSMAVYDSETVKFDMPESSTGIDHVITVCPTDTSGNVTSAGTLTALAAPTGDAVPTGKEFAGWRGFYFEGLGSKVTDHVYAAKASISVRENTTFHAVWNPKILTVKMDLNGGTGVDNTASVEYGHALTLSSDPTKSGYDFGGWTVNKAVTENGVYFGRGSAFDTGTLLTADLELTAQWKHIHSYTYYKISDFGDALKDYQSYESKLHIRACGCDDFGFEAHSFDSSGKCACGYRKLTETATLKISYGKWDGTDYTPKMAEADRTVVKGQEVSVYAPGSLGSDMKFSKWQYGADGSTWKDLTSYRMMGFPIPADMQLRALYTNPVTKPQISLSATTYPWPEKVEGYELNTILLQMDYQLPDGYYYVDSGVKASDNIGIAYYEMKEIKKTAGQKAALAGVKLGIGFLTGGGIGDFLVDQTMDAMSGPEYYYEKRENSVLDIMTAATLSDYIYNGKPVNMEKFDPLYWDYRPDTKGQSGSLNALIPLNAVQKNNWNHYIYGIAWLRYKDKAGDIQTIYTPALATTFDGVGSSTRVEKTGN